MQQLDIFAIVPDRSSRNSVFELPRAKLLLDPKVENALSELAELKELANAEFQGEASVSVGAIVRSSLFFKGKTAKVLKLEQVHTITLATVELNLNGNLIKFPCGVSALEVVE